MSNCRRGVILGREDIAGGPAKICAQFLQRFDQHGGLNRHMQASGNLQALEGLFPAILFAHSH